MNRFLATLILVALPLSVQAKKGDIQLDVKTHTFSNGLELLVVERHLSPTFSAIVRFKVGSTDERPGITGSAHLLEHMLFKGTKNIGTTEYNAEVKLMEKIDRLAFELTEAMMETKNPIYRGGTERVDSLRALIAKIQEEQKQYVVKDELWETYLKNGGAGLNASTGNDGTQYYVSLPSNRLELWAYLESDRLSNPVLREFYSERDVVYEERRMRTDNSPYGKLYEQFNAAAFTAHPYGWPVVGWASDLETVLREDVEEFFYQYYSPNNIVIAIIGDVKFEDVVKTIDRYFSKIPPSEKPVPPVTTIEPPQTGERRVAVEYDAEPSLVIGYHMPAGGDIDFEVFDIMSSVLTRGRTSRLYKSLVEERQIVTSIGAWGSFTRYPDVYAISATPKAPYSIEEIEQAIYEELAKFQEEGPTEWELQRVRNQLDADYVRGLQSNMGLARRLTDMQAKVGDWSFLMTLKERRAAVTAEDIKRVMAEYLVPKNRTVAYLVKPEKELSDKQAMKIQNINPKQAVAK